MHEFRGHLAALRTDLLILAAGAGCLACLPFVTTPNLLRTYTQWFLLAVMAQGWNLVGGFMGYTSFGNVAFFGIGAYTVGLLMLSEWRLPFLVALPLAGLLAAAFASAIGYPVLRLKGHYFAIATLGVAEAARQIADNWDSVTNGAMGIDLPLQTNSAYFFYTGLALAAGGVIATLLLRRSRLGCGWIAIREDEDASKTLGIHTARYKIAAWALSAGFAGLAGGVTAYQNIHVTPGDFFKVDYTLQMIIACVIGGPGTVWGPVVGAGIYQLLSTYLWGSFRELHPTFLGAIIIFFIVFLPYGLPQAGRAVKALLAGHRASALRLLLGPAESTRVRD